MDTRRVLAGSESGTVALEELPTDTTLFSLSSAPPAHDCRRGDDRHMTLFRVGSLSIGDRRELCLIKNISAGGMMIRAYGTIEERTCLSIELKCGQPVHGRVTWCRGVNIGVEFDEKIDVIDLLANTIEGQRPRMPRIEVDCHATIRDGATVLRVKVADISQGGIKIWHEARIAPGSDVVVTVPGMAAAAGVLRWSEGNSSGITFNRLLPLPQLMGWLTAQRDEMVRAS